MALPEPLLMIHSQTASFRQYSSMENPSLGPPPDHHVSFSESELSTNTFDITNNPTVCTHPQANKFQKLIVPSSTILQGLLLFTRHDATLLPTIEKTGIFDTMFSVPAKEVAYLILTSIGQVTTLQHTYIRNEQLSTSDKLYLRRIIKSLDTAIQLNSTACPGEAFLTAKALSIKIFLQTMLRHTTNTEEYLGNTAIQLMEAWPKPEPQLCSSLALCSSLESIFWQATMGAIAAPDARTKSFYMSRLGRITTALALGPWHDAEMILQRFLWIPSIFSTPCYHVLSEVMCLQDRTGV